MPKWSISRSASKCFPNFNHSDLQGTQVTDAGLKYLTDLTQLQTLSLVACPKLTDAGLKNLAGLSQAANR